MKKYRVLVSPSVNDRMYDHFLFLAEGNLGPVGPRCVVAQVSETAARNLLTRLIKDIQSLEYMPQRNPYFERPYLEQAKYRYKLSYRRYRIVYQIIKDCVFVEDIQDCRQDDDKNLV
jgi:mRNA-degrading endonuclease RelE of RelBE toxin-antitoxin system